MRKQHRVILKSMFCIRLMLAISEVFNILCLLCLCGNREYLVGFKTNQYALLSNYLLIISCSWSNGREKERCF